MNKREEVKEMDKAIDRLWLCLIVGYCIGAIGGTLLGAIFEDIYLSVIFLVVAMLPWAWQCVVAHKAIAKVNRSL